MNVVSKQNRYNMNKILFNFISKYYNVKNYLFLSSLKMEVNNFAAISKVLYITTTLKLPNKLQDSRCNMH